MSIRKPRGTPPRFEPLTPATAPGECVRTYRVTLATPIYGGGVQAGVPDKDMPVRVSSIRGQLRFWWRLLNGRGKSPRELFVAERELWGGLGGKPEDVKASRVRLTVGRPQGMKETPCAEFKKSPDGGYGSMPQFLNGYSGYALFPGQGKLAAGRKSIETRPAQLIQQGLKITLTVHFLGTADEFEREVLPALRFWASFGGLGARTRRGLGSVQVEGFAPVTATEAENAGCQLVLRADGSDDAIQVWGTAIGRLQHFRQGRGLGRNPGGDPKHPGRSRWPEPDAVRRAAATHAPAHPAQHPAGKVYPRALFGLPIIFHFKDEKDPGDTVLAPAGGDRFASPLILKAYWDGKAYRAAALLLPTATALRNRALVLANNGKGKSLRAPETLATGIWWPVNPESVNRKAAEIPPLHEHGGGDPLDAFLTYFAKD